MRQPRGGARRKLDDNDTKAFLDAEPVFTSEQLPRAQELASKYHEQLFEMREQSDRDHRE